MRDWINQENTHIPLHGDTLFGAKLKELRNQLQMSKEEFSFHLTISTCYLTKIEEGFLMPTPEMLLSIRETFNVKLSELAAQ